MIDQLGGDDLIATGSNHIGKPIKKKEEEAVEPKKGEIDPELTPELHPTSSVASPSDTPPVMNPYRPRESTWSRTPGNVEPPGPETASWFPKKKAT